MSRPCARAQPQSEALRKNLSKVPFLFTFCGLGHEQVSDSEQKWQKWDPIPLRRLCADCKRMLQRRPKCDSQPTAQAESDGGGKTKKTTLVWIRPKGRGGDDDHTL